MFFTNIFGFSERRAVCEHAYEHPPRCWPATTSWPRSSPATASRCGATSWRRSGSSGSRWGFERKLAKRAGGRRKTDIGASGAHDGPGSRCGSLPAGEDGGGAGAGLSPRPPYPVRRLGSVPGESFGYTPRLPAAGRYPAKGLGRELNTDVTWTGAQGPRSLAVGGGPVLGRQERPKPSCRWRPMGTWLYVELNWTR